MIDPTPPILAAALTLEAVGLMALVQLVIEDRIILGLDTHGTDTPRRLLDILAGWDRMARASETPGLPWSPQSAEARAGFRAAVEDADPMISVGAVLAVARRRR